ncbi:hypothetical protein K443DRAFT_327618 [Laccaria amethystina LaAM-08-1]|uniref:Uncharacterized protein n=1 Tax=Laccaria amethystina LaAM-08-1 TaxID=1095629 RepID=A0A0C9YCC5_9AGAR|nr:hypothetical protein K443DRAFT_327618 [Laccaria amethystina LaAM-08-1]
MISHAANFLSSVFSPSPSTTFTSSPQTKATSSTRSDQGSGKFTHYPIERVKFSPYVTLALPQESITSLRQSSLVFAGTSYFHALSVSSNWWC